MSWDAVLKEMFDFETPSSSYFPEAEPFEDIITFASSKYDVDPNYVKATIKAESNFNPKAISHVGAGGLMQIMPETADELGVRDRFNPKENVEGGTKYLSQHLKKYGGDIKKASAAYNAGAGNVDKAIERYGDKWLENLHKVTGSHAEETRKYIENIEKYYKGGDIEKRNVAPQQNQQTKQPLASSEQNIISGLSRATDQPSPGGPSEQWKRAFGYETGEEDWMSVISEEFPEEKPPGMIRSAGRGLVHGVLGLGETTGTALEYFGHRLGSEGVTEAGKTAKEYWHKKAEPFGPPAEIANKNVWDNPELLANASWWGYNVMDMLPAFAAMMVPAAGVEAAMVKIGTKMVPFSSASLERLFNIGRKVAVIGTGGLVGGGLEGMSTYNQVLEKGGSEEEAARAAEFMTIGAGVLNAIGINKILAKAGNGFKAKIIKTLGAGAWEGITEGLEEPTEVFSKVLAGHIEGKPIPEDIGQQLVESLKDAITVAPVAAVTGVGGSVFHDIGVKKSTTDPNKRQEASDNIAIQKKKAAKEIQDEILADEMLPPGEKPPTGPPPPEGPFKPVKGEIPLEPKELSPGDMIDRATEEEAHKMYEADFEKKFAEGNILWTDEAKEIVKRAQKELKRAKKGAIKSGDWSYHNKLRDDIRKARLPNIPKNKEALNRIWDEFAPDVAEPVELRTHFKPAEPKRGEHARKVFKAKEEIPTRGNVPAEGEGARREDLQRTEERRAEAGDEELQEEGVEPETIEVAGKSYIKQQGKWYDPLGNEIPYSQIEKRMKKAEKPAPSPEKTGEALEAEGVEPEITKIEEPTTAGEAEKAKEGQPKLGTDRRIAGEQRSGEREKSKKRRKAERRDFATRKAVERLSDEEKAFVIPELRRMLDIQKKAALRQKRIANSDPLTRLRNRRGLELETAKREKEGKETYHTFIDLIGFKGLNDYISHEAGDETLRFIAKAMKEVGLQNPTRWGGDELLFQSGSIEEGEANAQKLRDYFEENPLRVTAPDGKEYDLTVMFRHGTGKRIEEADEIAESKKATEPAEWKRGKSHPGLKEVKKEETTPSPEGKKVASEGKGVEVTDSQLKADFIKASQKNYRSNAERNRAIEPLKRELLDRKIAIPDTTIKPEPKKPIVKETTEELDAAITAARKKTREAIEGKEGETKTDYGRISERQKKAEDKYSPVFGTRVKSGSDTFELVAVNDLGIPYFSKVIKGKTQKKQFTLSGFKKDWLNKQIEQPTEPIGPKPPEEIKATGKEDKTVSVEMSEKKAEGLTPKEQKGYLLAEIDKAIEGELKSTGFEGGIEKAKEIQKSFNALAGSDSWFTFEVPGDGKFDIIGSKLFEFEKRVKSQFPAAIRNEKFRPRSVEQINYGAETRKYNKLIGKPVEKLQVSDMADIWENSRDAGLYNQNHFINWLLNEDINKSVADWIKKEESYSSETNESQGKIPDFFGEKIGGARKDTAERGYSMTEKPKATEKGEVWRKKYVAMEKIDGSGWTIGKKGDSFGISARGGQVFATQEEAEKAIPIFAVAEKHSVYKNKDGEFEIFKRVGKRKRFKVVGKTFSSREEGMKYMAQHAEEILNTKTTFGEEILPVPEIAVRTGKERRTIDATPEMFMETFTPRGIEFGNWNNQEERQLILNHAYDGLLDLAEVLNVPPKALMLNGELAIAFGARGQGLSGAKAHYEPAYGVINLTKMKGAGSLAHEWFHALDHYFARQDTKASSEKETNKRGDLVYKTKSNRYDFQSHGPSYKTKVRPELQAAYDNIIDTMYKKAKTYVEDMSYAEKFLGKARDNLKSKLDAMRSDLEKDLTKTYTWRKSKRGLLPASAEQLAEFDMLAETIAEGGNLETEYRYIDSENKRKSKYSAMAGRHTNDALEAISVIYKAVRGRTGFDSQNHTGILDKVRGAMSTYSERLKLFEDAEKGTEKTKTVPTSYAIEAKKMDQARTGDYWSEPHEMAARAFSSYVEDKIAEQGNQSDFIVYQAHGGILLPMIDGFVARPYPEGQERIDINKAFDGFVDTLKTKETDKGVLLYSAKEKPEAKTTVEKVFDIILPHLQGMTNFPTVKVVQSIDDLPKHLKNKVTAFSKKSNKQVEGFYDKVDDQVFLIADNLSEGRIEAVLRHEAEGHRGIRLLLGPELDGFLDGIAKVKKDELLKFDPKLNLKDIDAVRVAADEWVARKIEAGNLQATWWDKLIRVFRKWLRKFVPNLKLKDSEIRSILTDTVKNAREGHIDRILTPEDELLFSTMSESEPSVIKEKFKSETTLKEKIEKVTGAVKTKTFWDTTTTQLIDRLHPVRKAGEKAYRLHRIETGTQAVFAMLMEHGKLGWDKSGYLRCDEQKQGFLPFLRTLGKDWHKFPYWVAAKRAAVLEEQGREKWLDKKARDEIFEWAGGENKPEWEEAAKELKEFNANILDVAEKSGLINPNERKVWEQDFYVPFYRIFEDEKTRSEFLKAPRKNKKFISAQIKRLVGAERKLGDPLENLMHNWMHLISESMRNVARAEAYNFSIENKTGIIEPVGAKDIYSFYHDKDKKVVYMNKKTQEPVLMFQLDGKPKYFKVNDPELFNAMSNLNATHFDNFLLKMMGTAKRWLTFGATFGPGFRIANLLRDTMHTAMIDKSFKPFIDSARGVVKAWGEDPEYIAFMASGAGFGSSYVRADDPATAAKYIKRIIGKEGKSAKDRILDTPKKMLDFWEKVGSTSENAARVQFYSNLMKEGKSHSEAAFEARDLLDFTMRGEANVVQFLIQITPFLNARMQGLYKLGRAIADKENIGNFVFRGAMLMAASLALWAFHKDDDEYKELEDWDRWSYYHFWIGSKHFRIPKPFEVGAIFSSLPETMADVLAGDDKAKHIADFIGYTAQQTFAIGVPQLFNPIIEQWANKSSYTGRPIVGQRLEGLIAGEQKEPWTSETMQLAGKLGISPKRAEALIQGYFSTFGGFLLSGSDIIVKNLFDFPENPSLRIDDYPLVGRFIKEKEPSRYTRQQTWFYGTLNEIDKTVKTINLYKKLGDFEKAKKLIKESEKVRYVKMFRKTNKRLSEINKTVRRTLNSKRLTSQEKRKRLDKLSTYKNKILARMYKRLHN